MAEEAELFLAWTRGDRGALDRLLPLVYRELRDLAQAYLRRARRRSSPPPSSTRPACA